MTKLFLRSGSLDDFLALGENGQPVYASALQLRETLRLRKQQPIADCLAIPQPNENGDRIDWYSPIEGHVTSWIAASEQERAVALQRLETYQAAVAEISQRTQRSEKAGQKLFGVLLAKAIQFPGPNHVYLVDGNPVLTFWGFVNLDKKSRSDALDCLRPAQPVEKAREPMSALPASPYAEPPQTPEPPPLVTPEPTPEPAAAARTPWVRLWWLLPAAVLVAILMLQIRGCWSEQNAAPEPAPLASTIKPEKRALPTAARAPETKPAASDTPASAPPLPPETTPAPVEPQAETAPPAQTAASDAPIPESAVPAMAEPKAAETKTPVVNAPPAPAPKAAAEEAPPQPEAPATPPGKGDLVMPANAVRIGSISFLNGNWRVAIDAKTQPITGRPPSLRYQIRNGKGTARITHGDGVTCRANIEAGLMSSGNLIINSRTSARCSDNSRFQMPEIVCKQGVADVAECIGRYNADAVFPMTIKRESKS